MKLLDSAWLGLAMLPVAGLLIGRGYAAWLALVATSVVFAGLAWALGMPAAGLAALAPRLVGLLEHDLLQALPLFVLMGCLMHRLSLAERLLRSLADLLARLGLARAALPLAALGTGSLLAPTQGSVGAGVTMLARTLPAPALGAAGNGGEAARHAAFIAALGSLGVVIPPSLVLLLLGDAMMRAHTEAANVLSARGQGASVVQIVNTGDVLRGALAPAALLLLALAAVLLWQAYRRPRSGGEQAAGSAATAALPRASLADRALALATVLSIGGLLLLVALGHVFAVEAAASAALLVFVYGLVSRELTLPRLRAVLDEALALSGALFALLVAATTFSLVFRLFGTDRAIDAALAASGLGPVGMLCLVLTLLALCALVLDAFELIVVALPILMPPLLVQVGDAAWVAVLTLLVLQLGFMLPPFGYALLLAQGTLVTAGAAAAGRLPALTLARAALPYLAAQLLVIALVAAYPPLVRVFASSPAAAPAAGGGEPVPAGKLSDDEVVRQMMGAGGRQRD